MHHKFYSSEFSSISVRDGIKDKPFLENKISVAVVVFVAVVVVVLVSI